MRPPGPVPVTLPRSTPSTAAARRATGVAFTPSGAAAGFGASLAGAAAAPPLVSAFAGAAPPRMRATTWPTVTVSPTSTSVSVITPLAGEGSSASTLSVDTSTIPSSWSTGSPTFLSHSRITPSVTDSPMEGIVMSISVSAGASVSLPGGSSVGAGRGAVAAAVPVATGDLAEHVADRDRVALADEDLGDHAGRRGRHLGVDLVGGDLDQRVVRATPCRLP